MRAEEILSILDRCAERFDFPVMDNGYLYPAASRLSVHRSETDWAVVFESFEYSPRAGMPHLAVCTFASRIVNRTAVYQDPVQRENALKQHPNDESEHRFIMEADWDELLVDEWRIAGPECEAMLRGRAVRPPMIEDLRRVGITPAEGDAVSIVEWCRYLAVTERESVLATPDERMMQTPPGVATLLVLDEWGHPDLSGGETPSGSECFRQLADVLATGRRDCYAPTQPPNTHWSHWPDAGTL